MNPEKQPEEPGVIILNPDDSNDPEVKKLFAEGELERQKLEAEEKEEIEKMKRPPGDGTIRAEL